MSNHPESHPPEPRLSVLRFRLVQGAGILAGVLSTVWVFLYLLGQGFEYGEGLEMATMLIPVAALVAFLLLWKRKAHRLWRSFAVELFASSLVTYLLMQLVVARLI